ncbi:MAG: molybdopterin-binding protein, partial [Planctomycetota bacterium]
MKHATIIATGNELVRGDVRDENSPWLARALATLGFPARSIHVVPDEEAAIAGSLEAAVKGGAEAAVLAGGLGPTEDDRTRDAVAAFAGVDLVEHEGLAEAVASFLRARGRPRAPGALR